ncbi:ATP-grasp fold amidoligase family protein [Fibrobacter sp. UWB3]|uniref:ATP-grasp fold amidoligase family protein n=1 Tax=Fibrobacter sp. UWB3 TaxID=1964357 RepID=UPI000B6CDB5E|nr:ATP-grasp fold amidoligase family protein [Fibrobacter sp. UWB3]OWV22194.1 hypothetical protein B7991_02650 [Fibrobacter sp. UWB3]
MIKRFFYYLLKNPIHLIEAIVFRLNVFLPDKIYLSLLYRCKFGKWIDWKNPKTFSEKIQWLKVFGPKSEYSKYVDKYSVKKIVAEKIGSQHVIPTIGVWDNVDDIEWDSLPQQYVLKITDEAGGNGVFICRDSTKFDRNVAIEKIREIMRKKKSVKDVHREHPYEFVTRRIIAEKYMEDECGELRDYKFFCFDGVVKCLQVDYDRFIEHHRNIYDTEWNLLPFSIQYPSKKNVVIDKPLNFEVMLDIARCLSKGFPHVRIDLYNINGNVYFGEMTFYHGSGYEHFNPSEWDYKFGEWLRLPSKEMR